MSEFTCVIPNRLEEMSGLTLAVARFLEECLVGAETRYAVDLTLEEMVSNVVRHGYTDEALHSIAVKVDVHQREVLLAIEDDGHPFNPLEAATPDLDKPIEERRIGGLGIFLVRQTVDSMEYERKGERNVLRIRINRL